MHREAHRLREGDRCRPLRLPSRGGRQRVLPQCQRAWIHPLVHVCPIPSAALFCILPPRVVLRRKPAQVERDTSTIPSVCERSGTEHLPPHSLHGGGGINLTALKTRCFSPLRIDAPLFVWRIVRGSFCRKHETRARASWTQWMLIGHKHRCDILTGVFRINSPGVCFARDFVARLPDGKPRPSSTTRNRGWKVLRSSWAPSPPWQPPQQQALP